MKGKFEDIEVEIDGEKWSIPKLTLQDSYPLYADALDILVAGYIENNSKLDFKLIVNEMLRKFSYENALYYAKKCTKINKENMNYNLYNPLLIIELVGHLIIHNVIDELKKKDISAFAKRMFPILEFLRG